jgi:hypothetical protein
MPDHCPEHERFDVTCENCKSGRRENPLRLHDVRRVFSPCCRKPVYWTDSRSMVDEYLAYGTPASEVPALLTPIAALFQGEHAKIFLVKCECGKEYISFVDITNRERIEQVRADLLPYYPNIEEDADLRKRYLEPRRRDIAITKEEFAMRVLSEKNWMARDALVRKVNAAGFGVNWNIAPPRGRVATLVMPEGGAGPARGSPSRASP